jgi:hypothetical protein
MRADNLLALRAKPFVPRTTMRNHDCPIRPNLARRLKPTGLAALDIARARLDSLVRRS